MGSSPCPGSERSHAWFNGMYSAPTCSPCVCESVCVFVCHPLSLSLSIPPPLSVTLPPPSPSFSLSLSLYRLGHRASLCCQAGFKLRSHLPQLPPGRWNYRHELPATISGLVLTPRRVHILVFHKGPWQLCGSVLLMEGVFLFRLVSFREGGLLTISILTFEEL